jgi:hypothetical protein
LELGRGPGWSGQASWWYIQDSANPAIPEFLEKLKLLMEEFLPSSFDEKSEENKFSQNASTSSAYTRYIQAYEVNILPKHRDLQNLFCKYLDGMGFSGVIHDKNFVDIRYNDHDGFGVLCEVKPCNSGNARFAIRCAIGQLLDYKQKEDFDGKMLIVLENEPDTEEDVCLALENGFGVAWPTEGQSFSVKWV